MSREFVTTTMSGQTFRLESRYDVIKVIGAGAYGLVCSATDVETGQKVAIKKIPNWTADLIDAKRIVREIKLMEHCNGHENIIKLVRIQPPESRHFDDVYVISELMETDLHRIIQSKQALCEDHVQFFIYQILRALKFMHSANIVHRDLKPANILLNSSCELKLCDLGLARGIEDEKGTAVVLTEYVVTRWYRAPEIMLASREYGPPVDVWAVGCIMAELYLRKPLFPGKDYLHQLRMIVGMLGSPADEDLGFITSSRALEFIHNLPAAPPQSFERVFPSAPPAALDLLRKMLCFNPAKRITVEQALAHPYMEGLHAPDDEPACDHKFNFDWEAEAVDATSLRRLLWQEAQRLSPAMPDF